MHSKKEGWREIKRKRIAAKSVGAPTRLVKPTSPHSHLLALFPKLFSLFSCVISIRNPSSLLRMSLLFTCVADHVTEIQAEAQ